MTDIMEIMKQRHSVRQYTGQPIEPEKRAALDALCAAINKESGLHVQMIYDEPKCFDSMLAHYGRFTGARDYIALVGPKSRDLDEKAGYYGEKLVLKAQELGLNTCWVALTRGKSQAVVGKGEKLSIIISLGYGQNQGTEHHNKPLSTLAAVNDDNPQWYKDGVAAALLAPTAVNQQHFRIERCGGKAKITSTGGVRANVDLGIVKYHFEAVSGHETV